MAKVPDDQNNLKGETLLAGNTVRMFGVPFAGLTLAGPVPRAFTMPEPQLARIYGFAWQGNYFKMAAPAIFLVSGPGMDVASGASSSGAGVGAVEVLGIEFKDEFFSEKVSMWAAYDVDFSVRIDITGGWLSEILIAPEASDASNMTGSGDGADGGGRLVARQAVAARQAFVARPRST